MRFSAWRALTALFDRREVGLNIRVSRSDWTGQSGGVSSVYLVKFRAQRANREQIQKMACPAPPHVPVPVYRCLLMSLLVLFVSVSCVNGLDVKGLVRPLLPVLGWYALANSPIYGGGEWSGKAEGLGAMTNFATLENRLPLPAVANEYIVAPRGVAPRARVVEPGVSFDMNKEALFPLVERTIMAQDHIQFIAKDPSTLRLEVVQRTPLLNFPDVVTLQAVDAGGGKSSVAIHSYSIYGAGDLGTNKKRVLRFLDSIKQEANGAQAGAPARDSN